MIHRSCSHVEIGTVDADLKACWTKEPNSLLRGHSPTTEQIACDVYAAKTRYKYLGFGTLYSSSWNAKGLGGEVCPIVKEINLTCGVDEVYMWVSVFGEGHLFKPWVIIMECRKRSAARRTVHARPPSSAGTSCSSTSALSSSLSK